MRVSLAIALASFVTLAGCDGCDKKPDTSIADTGAVATALVDATATAVVDASTTATVSDASADSGTHAKHDMQNCPTSVASATIAIKDIEGGVEVAITGKDDATTKEIRERTKKLAEADKTAADSGARHDHSGSGGGTTGRCTIIMRNTKLETAEIANGSKVIVKAADKSEVDWIRRETRDRDREAKSAGAEGAGTQRMAHCPSSVAGAKTTVKDIKEGVVVTVTGPKEALGDIRERARHTAEVAKKESPGRKVEHTGGGTGGGGLGRCPIIVEGDTTVAVKDVEGGVDVEVKTTKDVAALQKEAKTRAANFTSK